MFPRVRFEFSLQCCIALWYLQRGIVGFNVGILVDGDSVGVMDGLVEGELIVGLTVGKTHAGFASHLDIFRHTRTMLGPYFDNVLCLF